MKTSKILLHTDKSNNEETPKEVKAGILLKSVLVIFLLSWITILSSCFVPVWGHEGHGDRHGHSDHREHGDRH